MGAGGYELIRPLGTGGMAEVFVARRRGLHGIEHTVVIKRLRDDVRSIPNITRMFAWEAWISSRMSHPNIVTFHDFVSHRGRDHLVLEHICGPDIATISKTLIANGRLFPIRAVLEAGIAAASALEHAHAVTDDEGRHIGLVHRDVSPQNLLVSVDGQIKLIDFGVAKTTSAHVPRETQAALVKGKMGYIAPEHLRGQPLDARADLYGLGVVLFEMLTGKPLVPRCADIDMIRAALLIEAPPLTTLRPDCPEALDAVVRRALAQDPAHRFEDAAAMKHALCSVMATVPPELGTPTIVEIARDIYAPRDERSVCNSVTRLPIVMTSKPRPLEPVTRPEGFPKRIRAQQDATPVASEATQQQVGTQTELEKASDIAATQNTTSRRASLLPLALAFALGVITTFVVGDVMRRGASASHKATSGSAPHATPIADDDVHAAEPGSKR